MIVSEAHTNAERRVSLREACYFCGRPTALLWHDPKSRAGQYQVRCQSCEARGPACNRSEDAVGKWHKPFNW